MKQDPELYQNHGDHIDAIMPTQEFLKLLPDLINESNVACTVNTMVSLEGYEDQVSDVVALLYGNRTRDLATLIAHNPAKNINEFVTAYPIFFDGEPYETTITKVVEWKNHLEATVWATIGDFEFAFFPTDYVDHKSAYRQGNALPINLSALAMKAEEADRGFEFTGQDAINFLAKIGREPEYDSDGNVEPIKFSTEKLVAYLATDDKAPDEAQFQSPVSNVEECLFLGIDFWRCDIIVHRDEEDDHDITLPLYFRKDMVPQLNNGDPIRGLLWMMGEIVPSKKSF